MVAISRCDLVVSSSLHGLVFADALGIPSVKPADTAGSPPSFKYLDYVSGLDVAQPAPPSASDALFDADTLGRMVDHARGLNHRPRLAQAYVECHRGGLLPRVRFADRVWMAEQFLHALPMSCICTVRSLPRLRRPDRLAVGKGAGRASAKAGLRHDRLSLSH
jgi:hypothetical protein